jgi:hypothetical protein
MDDNSEESKSSKFQRWSEISIGRSFLFIENLEYLRDALSFHSLFSYSTVNEVPIIRYAARLSVILFKSWSQQRGMHNLKHYIAREDTYHSAITRLN